MMPLNRAATSQTVLASDGLMEPVGQVKFPLFWVESVIHIRTALSPGFARRLSSDCHAI